MTDDVNRQPGTEDDIKFFTPLEDLKLNPVDPIKILLPQALRHGLVFGRNIYEVLQHTAARADRTVQWTDGKRPVLAAIGHPTQGLRSSFLDWSRPAAAKQILATVRKMGLQAGVLVPLISHDIRRGAARDVAHHTKHTTAAANPFVAESLGHTNVSHGRGVTKAYVGPHQAAVFNTRAAERFEDKLAPAVAASPYQHKRLKTSEIDAWCDEKERDPTLAVHRKQATHALKRSREDDWRQQQSDSTAEAKPQQRKKPASITAAATTKPRKGVLIEQTPSQINARQPHSPQSLIDPRLLTVNRAGHQRQTEDIPGLESDAMDLSEDIPEVELDAVEKLYSMIEETFRLSNGEDDAEDDSTEEIPEPFETELLADAFGLMAYTTPNVLTSSPEEFITFLSTTNVSSNSMLAKPDGIAHPERYVPTGNSRSAPSLLQFCCTNQPFCQFASPSRVEVERHEFTCRTTGRDSFGVEKPFLCVRDGCGKSYARESSLRDHVRDTHDFRPRKCELGCTDGHEFTDRGSLIYHISKYHREQSLVPYEPRKCPNKSECKMETVFGQLSSLRYHLVSIHLIPREEHGQLLGLDLRKAAPDGEGWKTPRLCGLEDCGSTTLWKSAWELAQHWISESHAMSYEEVQSRLSALAVSDAWIPQRCNLPGCTSETLFQSPANLRKHWKSLIHGMSEEDALALLPMRVRSTKTEHLCPVNGCQSEVEFPDTRAIQKHLIGVHQMSQAEAEELAPVQRHRQVKTKEHIFCPINGCDKEFVSNSILHEHLRGTHKKTQKEADELVTVKRRQVKSKEPIRCPINGCRREKPFAGNSNLQKHLVSSHEKSQEEAKKLAPCPRYAKRPKKSA